VSTDIKRSDGGGLTVQLVSEMTGYSPAEIALVSRSVAQGANLQELAVFLRSCRALSLDPLLRQAYWIRRQGKGGLQVGIDGFRAIADRSGAYAGAESIEFRGATEWTYKGKKVVVPELARATIWKVVAGHKSAFVGEAYWNEFVPTSDSEAFMWNRMPKHMLGKCAEAQALRRAFPAQLGALSLAADTDAEVNVSEDQGEPMADRQKRLAKRHAEIYDEAYDLPDKALPAQAAEEGPVPDSEVIADDDE